MLQGCLTSKKCIKLALFTGAQYQATTLNSASQKNHILNG